MYADKNAAVATEATLNDRLNRIAEALMHHCDRLQSVLNRVNGTPPTPISGALGGREGGPATVRPVAPMTSAIGHLEEQSGRLADLCSNVERIA